MRYVMKRLKALPCFLLVGEDVLAVAWAAATAFVLVAVYFATLLVAMSITWAAARLARPSEAKAVRMLYFKKSVGS